MKYFTYIGIAVAIATEFAKAMADGKIDKGEWIDVIFNTADKTTEALAGIDLDPFRPLADEVKTQLAAGHGSLLGLLRSVYAALDAKGIDYKFDLPGGKDL